MGKKKVNPRRQIVHSIAQKNAIRNRALRHCWEIAMTVLSDKHGWGQKKLSEFWNKVNDTSALVIDNGLSLDKMVAELIRIGVEPRKFVWGQNGNVEMTRKEFEAKGWVIILYTLMRTDGLQKEALQTVWKECRDLEQSKTLGYVSDKDLIETLYDEQKVRLTL